MRYPAIVSTCVFLLYMQSAHVIEHYAGGLSRDCNIIHTYATLIHSNILYMDPGHMSPGKCSQAGPSWVPSASVHPSVSIWHCWAAHGPSEAAAAPPRAPRTADSRSRMGGSHAILAKRVLGRPMGCRRRQARSTHVTCTHAAAAAVGGGWNCGGAASSGRCTASSHCVSLPYTCSCTCSCTCMRGAAALLRHAA